MTEIEIQSKVDDLLKEMTLEEKVGQLHQTHQTCCSYEEMLDMTRKGQVGSVLLWGVPYGNENDLPEDSTHLIQKVAIEESRLGIPVLFGLDVIHGLRTVFPIPLGLAASWSWDMARRTAEIAAAETRSLGVHWTFTPMLDIARDPRWGRIAEGFGEDPYLCSELAYASVIGYQGEKDLYGKDKIMACAKHFMGYGAAIGGRDHTNSEIPPRSLRDIYLPSFISAVKAGVGSVMTAFNDLDGIPCTINSDLLNGTLRSELGFDGLVVTDWNTIDNVYKQGLVETKEEAAEMALLSGVTMDMISGYYLNYLPKLVETGKVPSEILDRAVETILKIKFRLGLFDQPYADFDYAKKTILCPEHKKIALEAAEKSMVLLRNENNALPLSQDVKKLAVIGPLAKCGIELSGCWNMVGKDEDVISVLDGIKAAAPESTQVIEVNEGFSDTLIKANKSDAIVLVVGEHHKRSGEARDVTTLKLPSGQEELVKKVCSYNIPVILVVFAGRPLDLSWASENVAAILYAWHPGVMGGEAVANILFGKVNPSGKLPVTFPRCTGQVPIYYNCKPDIYGKSSNKESYYNLQEQGPMYPFGYGLSYSQFLYENLKISPYEMTENSSITVTADITNTGDIDGEEIVQLYVRDCVASVIRPVKELKKFERVFLKRGETVTVTFSLKPDDLAFTRHDMSWGYEPGEFELWIGPHSDEGLIGKFFIEKQNEY